MNIINKINYFYARKIEPGFKVDKNALVIDIGSGDKPFWRADVYVDKLNLGNIQRFTNSDTIHDLGVFVDASADSLPFKDNVFDFSFCSHLLEHVSDPIKVINEITRVSKAGYIEVPNALVETIRPFHSHLWLIYDNKKSLLFYRKTKQMHEAYRINGKKYDQVIPLLNDPFIRKYWKRKMPIEVYDIWKDKEKFVPKQEKKYSTKSLNLYLMFIKIFRAMFYTKKTIPQNIYKRGFKPEL